MQIIFNRDIAEQMSDRFTILELETFQANDQEVTAFCVVSADKIPLGELATMDEAKRMHAALIKELKVKNYSFCEQAMEHLYGKFGGELNSFYDEIKKRISMTQSEA